MMTQPPPQPDTIMRIECALLLLAYFIELDGDVHVPMYEKFEAELANLRATANARTRASERLAGYRRSGDRLGGRYIRRSSGRKFQTRSAPCGGV